MIPLVQVGLAAVTAVGWLAVVIELVRRRQLREKYAALWLATGVVMLVLTVFPALLQTLSATFQVQSGANLLFFAGMALLLGVSLHLSWECSRLEEQTRTLAERSAILDHAVAQLRGEVEQLRVASVQPDGAGDPPSIALMPDEASR